MLEYIICELQILDYICFTKFTGVTILISISLPLEPLPGQLPMGTHWKSPEAPDEVIPPPGADPPIPGGDPPGAVPPGGPGKRR